MSAAEAQVKVRRLARLAITPELIVEMLKGGLRQYEVIDHALPDDAQMAWAYTEPQSQLNKPQTVWLVIESESFKAIKEGMIVPDLPSVICKRV